MNFAETLKGLVKKKPAKSAQLAIEPVMGETKPSAESLPNPYLTARRTWNDHVGGLVTSKQVGHVFGMLGMLVALASVGGIVHIGSLSKFVPYVVEVDKLGQQTPVAPASVAAPADPRVIHAQVASFVCNARMVTPDVKLQTDAIFSVYAMLSPNDPATQKMNTYLNGDDKDNPLTRAETETVSCDIANVLQQTPETWEVDWNETVYDRNGVVKVPTYPMKALVTVYEVAPTKDTTEKQFRSNPQGIYVRDFNWTKQN